MSAIPLRAVLQRLVIGVNWIYQCDICNPRCAGGRLGRMGLVGPGSAVGPVAPPKPSAGNRERLAGGAGGGNERPCSPARCRRNPRRDGRLTPPKRLHLRRLLTPNLTSSSCRDSLRLRLAPRPRPR